MRCASVQNSNWNANLRRECKQKSTRIFHEFSQKLREDNVHSMRTNTDMEARFDVVAIWPLNINTIELYKRIDVYPSCSSFFHVHIYRFDMDDKGLNASHPLLTHIQHTHTHSFRLLFTAHIHSEIHGTHAHSRATNDWTTEQLNRRRYATLLLWLLFCYVYIEFLWRQPNNIRPT